MLGVIDDGAEQQILAGIRFCCLKLQSKLKCNCGEVQNG
jgi:hypothetical protein